MSRFLLAAAGNGDAAKVESLLDGGADIEWRHKGTGRTALSEAAIAGSLAVARLLIDRRANIDPEDTAMGFTPLGWAVECGHPDLVELLLKAGAQPNVATPEYRLSPLLVAAAKGDVRIVSLLVGAGADVNAAAADGRTALTQAELRKHAEVVAVLLKAGATAGAPLPKPTRIPWPPVGEAVDYSTPDRTLRSFILAMNSWETLAASLGVSDNKKALAAMEAVFAVHCTPAKRPYGRAGSYQTPPQYGPDNEFLIDIKLTARRAELTTRDSADREEFLYVVVKKGDRWLVDSKKRRHIGTKWRNTNL